MIILEIFNTCLGIICLMRPEDFVVRVVKRRGRGRGRGRGGAWRRRRRGRRRGSGSGGRTCGRGDDFCAPKRPII